MLTCHLNFFLSRIVQAKAVGTFIEIPIVIESLVHFGKVEYLPQWSNLAFHVPASLWPQTPVVSDIVNVLQRQQIYLLI